MVRYLSVDNVGNAESVKTAARRSASTRSPPDARDHARRVEPVRPRERHEIFVNTSQTGSLRRLGYELRRRLWASTRSSSRAASRIPQPVLDHLRPGRPRRLGDGHGARRGRQHGERHVHGHADTPAPTGGSVDYPDGYDADGDVTVTVDAGTDALSRRGRLLRRPRATDLSPRRTGLRSVRRRLERGNEPRHRARLDLRPLPLPRLRPSRERGDLHAAVEHGQGRPDGSADDHRRRAERSEPDASPSFEFSSSEGASTFDCRLDGGAWSACSSPESDAALADGRPHLRGARDRRGAGTSTRRPPPTPGRSTPQRRTRRFDVVPPDPSNDDSPTLRVLGERGRLDLRVPPRRRRLGAVHEPRDDRPSPTAATHSTCARPTRPATPTASRAAHVDGRHARPGLVLQRRPRPTRNDSTPTFEFSASEGGSTFECRSTAAPGAPAPAPRRSAPLADGSHSFDVRATDAAGNEETTPESYTWVVDAPPSVSITQPSAFVNGSDSDPYTVRATSPDGDVSGIEFFSCSNASVGLRRRHLGLARNRRGRAVRSFVAARCRRKSCAARRRHRRRIRYRLGRRQRHDRPHGSADHDRRRSRPTPRRAQTRASSSTPARAAPPFECRRRRGDPSPAAGAHRRAGNAARRPRPHIRRPTPTSAEARSHGIPSEARLTGLAGHRPRRQRRRQPGRHTWTIDSTAPGGSLTDPGQFSAGRWR